MIVEALKDGLSGGLDDVQSCREGIFKFRIALHGLGGPGGDFGAFAEGGGEDVNAFFLDDGGVDVEADGVGVGECHHGVGDVVSYREGFFLVLLLLLE